MPTIKIEALFGSFDYEFTSEDSFLDVCLKCAIDLTGKTVYCKHERLSDIELTIPISKRTNAFGKIESLEYRITKSKRTAYVSKKDSED